jgi:branched-chain amino acid transport system substrate-binding protein
VVVAALALSACSDDDSSSDSTDAPATTGATDTTAAPETTMPAKSPILIGGTFDTSGLTGVPESIKVVEAWASYINAKGGINGHPVELDIRETNGDPATAASETADVLSRTRCCSSPLVSTEASRPRR